MTLQHNALTGSQLHEPKGVATASSGQVYVADGGGSGDWVYPKIPYCNINTVESDAVSISSIGITAQTLAFSNDGPSSLLTSDAANNRLTLTIAGVYFVKFDCSFSTVTAGDAGRYEFKILDDAVATGVAAQRDMSGSSDAGTCSASGLITVGANSQITVSIESDDGSDSDDINVYHSSLSAFLVGAT